MISIENEKCPWGRFYVSRDEFSYNPKRIETDHEQELSYLYHKMCSDAWTIVEGKEILTGSYIMEDNIITV